VIGRTLSHYRIVEALGAGGMGEVYRARDEKLGRDVALKVLPAESLSDEAARRRFRKEAEALVRLSHPHIATLFDVDSAEGVDFLVMERVAGRTLEEELRPGPLGEKEVVRLGTQLLRALVAAHGHGVVHRDLKPSNLALTEDGLLKVLDFGLARLLRGEEGTGGETTATETAPGHVVGSPPYMAPEQLRGKETDERTDLYAAGAVLYELATGRRVFGRRSGVDLTDAILHEAPPSPRSVAPDVSPGLEAVIVKALDKDPGLRYQTAREMLVDLERLDVASSAAEGRGRGPAARRGRGPGRSALPAAAVAGAVLIGAAAWILRPPPPPRITNFRSVTAGLESGRSDSVGPDWATDGTRLYYLSTDGTVRNLDQIPITGGDVVRVKLPFSGWWELYGFVEPESALLMGETLSPRASTEPPPLFLVPVPAGAARRFGVPGADSAAATRDGERLALVRSGRILLVRRDGSPVAEITSLPTDPIRATLSPDGRRVRYEAPGPDRGDRWIWQVSVDGGPARPLWPGGRGRWTRDGRYYLFDRFNQSEDRHDLYAARRGRFPWSSAEERVRLTSGPLSFHAVGPGSDGRRLFAWGIARRGELLRYDVSSQRFEPYLGGLSAGYVDASRDGEWLTWVTFPDGTLWRGRADGSDRLRLTGPGWSAHMPRWSPDGRRIVFAGRPTGASGLSIYLIAADGGEPEVLVPWDDRVGNLWDPCWAGDDVVLYSSLGPLSSRNAGLSTEGSHPPGISRVGVNTREVTLVPGSESLFYPRCSARGDILACRPGCLYSIYSVERGAWEPLGRRCWSYPNWSRDGETITALNQAEQRIERWSRRTGRFEVVADVSEIPLGSWANAYWTGLAPDGSPLIMRDRSTRDLYALEWEAP
jgi:tRNA A-37 threonylcarbamoyl transferase component Bud32